MRASPFFDGVSQVESVIQGHDFQIPLFYVDTTVVSGAFPARLSELRRMLPDRRMNPARIAPGVGLIAVTAFEYEDCGIGPYNELSISIPLNEPYYRPNIPGRAMIEGIKSGQLHSYVYHLPVTTETARVGGRELWNYPKFVASIDFSDVSNRRICRLAEGEEHILSMDCERIRGKGPRELQIFSHLWMDRQPQSSEFKLNIGNFGSSFRPGSAKLELGSKHPISLELSRVLLSRNAVNAMYMQNVEAILYGPEHLSLQFLSKSLQWSEDGKQETITVKKRT